MKNICEKVKIFSTSGHLPPRAGLDGDRCCGGCVWRGAGRGGRGAVPGAAGGQHEALGAAAGRHPPQPGHGGSHRARGLHRDLHLAILHLGLQQLGLHLHHGPLHHPAPRRAPAPAPRRRAGLQPLQDRRLESADVIYLVEYEANEQKCPFTNLIYLWYLLNYFFANLFSIANYCAILCSNPIL